MRQINRIYIHESASKYGNALLINWWHWLQGFSVKLLSKSKENKDLSFYIHAGYHYIISNGFIYNSREKFDFMDGSISQIRPLEKSGAAVKHDNFNSIHICLIKDGDENSVTKNQWKSLYNCCIWLLKKYNLKVNQILGHYEYFRNKGLKSAKKCPRIDMNKFRNNLTTRMNNDIDNKKELCELINDLNKNFYEIQHILDERT